MFYSVSKSIRRFAALACTASIPLALGAQNSVKSAVSSASGDSASRWDIFAGYGFLAPNDTINETSRFGLPESVTFKLDKVGMVESVSHYYTPHFGLQIDSGQHDRFEPCEQCFSNSGIFTVQAGPVYRWPGPSKFTPWVHGLVGGGQLEGPDHQNYTPGYTLTAGAGLDYSISYHWALRAGADYQFMHVNYGAAHQGPPWDGAFGWQPGGIANLEGARLEAGVVYKIGSFTPPAPITLDCSASPVSVFPGDPVTVTATAGTLNPKLNVVYSLTGPGITVSGTTATLATASLAPGTYAVNCEVKEGKPGKEGLKPWESAAAAANVTVKPFEPPTISCSVSPSTIKPGETSTVTCAGVSPQNRPLTYSYTATSGSITGSGAIATFSSAGAPTGAVGITGKVTDDKGQVASANTGVTITAPYVAPVPHTQALCSINFANDKRRPTRVDNEAKACLDEIALDLQKQSDAKVVVVGNSSGNEKDRLAKDQKLAKRNKHLKVVDPAAERAVNTKDYLVTEKGIDAARISVATRATDAQTVENYMVPSGASFSSDVSGTTLVDEVTVKAQPRKALPAKHMHARHMHARHMQKRKVARKAK